MASDIYTKSIAIRDFLTSLDFNAEISYAPELTLSQLHDEKVIIAPRDKKVVNDVRSKCRTEYKIDICLLIRTRENTVDNYVEKSENLAKRLLNSRFDKAIILDITFNPLIASDELRTKHLFVSILTLTLMEIS